MQSSLEDVVDARVVDVCVQDAGEAFGFGGLAVLDRFEDAEKRAPYFSTILRSA